MRNFIWIFLVFLSEIVDAQDTRFYAATDAAVLDARSRTFQVVQNSEFQISFTIENGQGSGFTAPGFGNLTVLQGPMRSSEISNINGRRTEKKSFVYNLAAVKSGKYTIGKASIRTASGMLYTDPFTIVVKEGNTVSEASNKKTFVTVEINDSTAYLGQQLILELKLYTQENIKKYEPLTDFNFDGFYVRQLNEFSRRSQRVIRNGEEFFTTTLQAVALFPQQTGLYEIPAFAVRVGLPKLRPRRSLFSFQEYAYKVLNTDRITIEVNDVPTGAPLSFSGGVGKYSAKFSIDKKSVTTDDNITMVMEIRGNGDSKKVLSPYLDLGDNFEVYEPNLLRDEEYIDRTQVINYKSYEFLIVPKEPGQFRLQPEFTYFDPDSSEYVSISKEPVFVVNVLKGSNVATDLSSIKDRNLAPPMSMKNRDMGAYGFMGSIWHWGILSLIGLGILGMYSHQIYLRKQAAIDPALISQRKANKVAVQRLEEAAMHKRISDERLFYDTLTKTILTYLEDKLTIRTGSLSKSQLEAELKIKLPETTVPERVIDLLQKSEIALFAGGKTGQMEEMYQNALDIIGEIEET